MATFAKKRAFRPGPRKLTGPEQFAYAFEGCVARMRTDYVPDAVPLDVLTSRAVSWLEANDPQRLEKARRYFAGTGFSLPIRDAVATFFLAVRADSGNTAPEPS